MQILVFAEINQQPIKEIFNSCLSKDSLKRFHDEFQAPQMKILKVYPPSYKNLMS